MSIRIRLRFKRRTGEVALFAILDEEDWKLAAIPWRAQRSTTGAFYASRLVSAGRLGTRMIYLHREVMKADPGIEVDHRNGDTLDCRRGNLRLVTHAQNMMNSRALRANSTSGFKGVSRTAGGRWRAVIKLAGRQHWLGAFDTEEEASGAYDSAAYSMFGEFARLNRDIKGGTEPQEWAAP